MTTLDKETLSQMGGVEKTVLRPDISYEDSQIVYKKWAEVGTYDDIHHESKDMYKGQVMLGETMDKLFAHKHNLLLLDAGAGTGLTGGKLQSLGYKNIDAVEPLAKFAEMCKERGFYQRVMMQPIGLNVPIDVPDNTYDAVCTVGAFGPGAIPPSGFKEFIRVTKPGGYIINCMREEFLWTVPMYRDKLQPFLKDLENQGLLQQVEWVQYAGHFGDKPGVRMLFRVC